MIFEEDFKTIDNIFVIIHILSNNVACLQTSIYVLTSLEKLTQIELILEECIRDSY